MDSRKRRLAAIMITDIVGFSSISRRSEELAMRVLEEHDRLLRGAFLEYEGEIVKTMGDSFLVEFSTVVGAVQCAVAIQNMLHTHNESLDESRRFQIRIGVHLGDVIHVEGDVFGDGVNIAARLEPLAGPGGICVSRQVYDLVFNKVRAPMVSEGKHRLKNIDGAVEVFRVLLPWQEEGWEPPTETFADERGKSIVVLPFADMSRDSDQEYFCDGMTEELIDALSRVESLKVVARTSSFAFKNRNIDVREIGRRLDVETVLEGSVRTAGNRARITAQLIDVTDGYHYWSERYDRELEDIFTVQEELAVAIVEKLRIRLLGKDKERLMRRHTDDATAHSIYLEGRYFWNQRKADSLQKAIACFKRASERDPSYALPYVGLADSFSILGTYGFMKPTDAFGQARAAARRALELCDDLGEAHATLGWVHTIHDFAWDKAEAVLNRAIQLSPSYASAHCWLAMSLLGQGRREEALTSARRSRELDPLSLIINANLGLVLTFAGLVDEAILQYRRTIELERRFPLAHLWLGVAHLVKGDYDAAIASFTDGMQVGGHNPFALGHLVIALSAAGRGEQAEDPLRRVESPPSQGYHSSYCRAVARFGIGDDDVAYGLLDQAYDERDPMLIFVQSLRQLPCLGDRLVRDPRYGHFLGKMALSL